MLDIKKFYDSSINVTSVSKIDKEIGKYRANKTQPIIEFNSILINTRKKSQSSNSIYDEISTMQFFKKELKTLSQQYKLSSNHFQIDSDGDPLLIQNETGEHYISPTHFEKGAYFSSPHFDYELNFSSERIPKIHIGKFTRFGQGSAVNVGADVYIGDCVWLAPGSTLLRQEHNAYGQPSIGSRTMAMTTQPPIHIADYAWIGRDAIVGWGARYIGKCSIVGARSFINKWVGDYSIVGDHSKILGYLPYKAYFMEYYSPSLKDVLQISDWEKIFEEWKNYYNKNIKTFKNIFPSLTSFVQEKLSIKSRVLIINPTTPSLFADFPKKAALDILIKDKSLLPFILQEAQNMGMQNVRTRILENLEQLPLETNLSVIGRETGYDLMFVNKESITHIELSILKNSLKSDGLLIDILTQKIIFPPKNETQNNTH